MFYINIGSGNAEYMLLETNIDGITIEEQPVISYMFYTIFFFYFFIVLVLDWKLYIHSFVSFIPQSSTFVW